MGAFLGGPGEPGPEPTLLDQFEAPTRQPERPSKDFPGPVDAARETFRSLYALLKSEGVPEWIAWAVAAFNAGIVFTGAGLLAIVLWALKTLGVPIAAAVLKIIDKTRKELDPAAAELASDVLNELTGADFDPADIPTGKNFRDHVERARAIGARLHEVFRTEFVPEGQVTPESGVAAAQRFSGFVTNFAVSTAILGILGELETLGAIDEFRDLGVQTATNLGLGRLHRLALRPLIQELIVTPLEWSLKREFRTSIFKPNEVVQLFHAGFVREEDAHEELARQGWTTERINALFSLHAKRLTVTELDRLVRWEVITPADAVEILKSEGFPQETAERAFLAAELGRLDSEEREFVKLLRRQFVDGVIDSEQHLAALQGLHLTDRELKLERVLAATEKETPHRFLTVAQLNQALDQGVIDVDELNAELDREGYSRDDQTILRLLALLRLAREEEAKKTKAERDAARAARRAKKGTPPPAG